MFNKKRSTQFYNHGGRYLIYLFQKLSDYMDKKNPERFRIFFSFLLLLFLLLIRYMFLFAPELVCGN